MQARVGGAPQEQREVQHEAASGVVSWASDAGVSRVARQALGCATHQARARVAHWRVDNGGGVGRSTATASHTARRGTSRRLGHHISCIANFFVVV